MGPLTNGACAGLFRSHSGASETLSDSSKSLYDTSESLSEASTFEILSEGETEDTVLCGSKGHRPLLDRR